MNIHEISQTSKTATVTFSYDEIRDIASALHKLDHAQLAGDAPCTNDVYRLSLEMDMVRSILREGLFGNRGCQGHLHVSEERAIIISSEVPVVQIS